MRIHLAAGLALSLAASSASVAEPPPASPPLAASTVSASVAEPPLAVSALMAGTRPTYLKNATNDMNIGFWVDNGGRGLRKDVDTSDGRAARVPLPGEVVAADDTCLYDEPSIRVYKKDDQGRWVCVCIKHISYILIPVLHEPDPNNWLWDGKELRPY